MIGILIGVVLCLISPPLIRDFTGGVWLARLWHGMGLPPQGEAWAVVPVFTFAAQWLIVGGIIGLWLRHRNLKLVK
jgi:hypothetical protein